MEVTISSCFSTSSSCMFHHHGTITPLCQAANSVQENRTKTNQLKGYAIGNTGLAPIPCTASSNCGKIWLCTGEVFSLQYSAHGTFWGKKKQKPTSKHLTPMNQPTKKQTAARTLKAVFLQQL